MRLACTVARCARALTVTRRPQEDEDGPRPLTGFFFGNVTNRLRLQKDEGRYLGQVRAHAVARRSAVFLRLPAVAGLRHFFL